MTLRVNILIAICLPIKCVHNDIVVFV